jgi:putative PIG3 family NAD(P)H quinone oxidoreductase
VRALIADERSGVLSLEDVDDPRPGPGDVLVEVRAAGVNRADLLQRAGDYPPPAGESDIIGLECAGIISAVGSDVSGWRVGDPVCALLPGGGYAERVVVPAGLAIAIPEGLSFAQAAAVPEAFLTAFLNLVVVADLRESEHVLIHAGASGVGTAAIQVARELGAVPIVTAGTPAKLELCRRLGAAVVINHRDGPFAHAVRDATNGHGVDVVLDPIGAKYWDQNYASLVAGGRWVVIGGLGGYRTELDIRALMQRRVTVHFSTLRSRSRDDKSALVQKFTRFAASRLAEGKLTPVIDEVFDWRDAMAAHQRLETNSSAGKVVLTVGEEAGSS